MTKTQRAKLLLDSPGTESDILWNELSINGRRESLAEMRKIIAKRDAIMMTMVILLPPIAAVALTFVLAFLYL